MKTRSLLYLPSALLLGTVWQAHAAFTAVDDFNARTVGNINGQGGWLATDATSAQVVVDPGNVINKILLHNGGGDAGKVLPVAIAENSTGTYFFRVKRVSGTSDTSFGLSDSTSLTTGNLSNFGSFEVQPNIVGNALRGRDFGTPHNVVPTMATTAWYKVWLVVNNVAGNGTAGAVGDNYKIYVQSVDDGAFATQTEYLPPNTPPPADGVWNFRVGTTSALGIAQFTSNVAGTSVYFDDLYIDNTGANLTDPTFISDPDTDDDGLEDAWEIFYFGSKTAQNGSDGVTTGDSDGLSNLQEQSLSANPNLPDTDGDGLNDGPEVTGSSNSYSPGTPTSPIKVDTDGDGLNDFQENGSLNNLFANAATDPNNVDSDFDTFPDYAEIKQYATNPNNSNSVPLLLTLIDKRARNGSFELLGPVPGVENTAMASHWDTDSDGDVTYWTLWPVESTLATNSGTETLAPVTHGRKRAYLQPENAVYNLTDHIAVAGETVAFKFDHIVGGPTLRVGLVYDNGGTIIRFPAAAEVSSTATGNGRGLIYTIPEGSPAIGKKIGIGMKATTAPFQDVDNVVLTVTAADVDLDGLADKWEDQYFGDNDGIATLGELAFYDGDDLAPDSDEFTNLQEQTAGSDPTSGASYPGDIDADGLNDQWEIDYFLTISYPNGDPGDDPDGDYDINSFEQTNGTGPNDKGSFYSSTGDTVPDSWKAFHGIPTQTGADDLDEGTGDLLPNTNEFYSNTDPNDKDSDNDGLNDGPEVLTYFSNPLVQDTDGDGLLDGPEVNTHLSSPTLVDTDGDSFTDKYEVDHLTLPYDALSVPAQPSGFAKLEDFQGAGMTVGQPFNGVNGWVTGISSFGTVANEPVSGGGDQVGLLVRATGVPVAVTYARKSLGTDAVQIREGNTGTLFFQVYCSVGALDQSFGFSDIPAAAAFGDFEAQFATVNASLFVRDGLPATTNRDTNFDYTTNQWMNVWIVANNSSDTVKVYVQTPTGQVGQIEITNDGGVNPFDFRNGVAANTLSHFLIVNNGGDNLPVYIDNIYVDPLAQNLAVPAGVTKPGLGDGDTMDDTWETTYFGNTAQTETGDFDNDGTDNLTEFRLGLIPNTGSSRFAVGSTQATVGNFTLTWPSKTGVTFKIERSTSLAAASWSILEAAYPGTPGTTTYHDASAPTGAAFYKVTLNP